MTYISGADRGKVAYPCSRGNIHARPARPATEVAGYVEGGRPQGAHWLSGLWQMWVSGALLVPILLSFAAYLLSFTTYVAASEKTHRRALLIANQHVSDAMPGEWDALRYPARDVVLLHHLLTQGGAGWEVWVMASEAALGELYLDARDRCARDSLEDCDVVASIHTICQTPDPAIIPFPFVSTSISDSGGLETPPPRRCDFLEESTPATWKARYQEDAYRTEVYPRAAQIRHAIQAFVASHEEEDQALLYFSSHGFRSRAPRGLVLGAGDVWMVAADTSVAPFPQTLAPPERSANESPLAGAWKSVEEFFSGEASHLPSDPQVTNGILMSDVMEMLSRSDAADVAIIQATCAAPIKLPSVQRYEREQALIALHGSGAVEVVLEQSLETRRMMVIGTAQGLSREYLSEDIRGDLFTWYLRLAATNRLVMVGPDGTRFSINGKNDGRVSLVDAYVAATLAVRVHTKDEQRPYLVVGHELPSQLVLTARSRVEDAKARGVQVLPPLTPLFSEPGAYLEKGWRVEVLTVEEAEGRARREDDTRETPQTHQELPCPKGTDESTLFLCIDGRLISSPQPLEPGPHVLEWGSRGDSGRARLRLEDGDRVLLERLNQLTLRGVETSWGVGRWLGPSPCPEGDGTDPEVSCRPGEEDVWSGGLFTLSWGRHLLGTLEDRWRLEVGGAFRLGSALPDPAYPLASTDTLAAVSPTLTLRHRLPRPTGVTLAVGGTAGIVYMENQAYWNPLVVPGGGLTLSGTWRVSRERALLVKIDGWLSFLDMDCNPAAEELAPGFEAADIAHDDIEHLQSLLPYRCGGGPGAYVPEPTWYTLVTGSIGWRRDF